MHCKQKNSSSVLHYDLTGNHFFRLKLKHHSHYSVHSAVALTFTVTLLILPPESYN